MSRRLFALAAGVVLLFAFAPARSADPVEPKVTTPKAHFGFNLGDDYHLANYEQYSSYLGKLAKESDRIKVVDIGETAEKRTQLMAIVTSPENHKKLADTVSQAIHEVHDVLTPGQRKVVADYVRSHRPHM